MWKETQLLDQFEKTVFEPRLEDKFESLLHVILRNMLKQFEPRLDDEESFLMMWLY